jgi:hypothetical protein
MGEIDTNAENAAATETVINNGTDFQRSLQVRLSRPLPSESELTLKYSADIDASP